MHLDAAYSQQVVLLAGLGLLGSVDLQEDLEQIVQGRRIRSRSVLDEDRNVVGDRLQQEAHATIAPDLAVVAHVLRDFGRLFRPSMVQQLLRKASILGEDVVRDPQVRCVDGGAQIAIEELQVQVDAIALLSRGLECELPGLQRDEAPDVAGAPEAAPEEIEKLAEHFDLQPAARATQVVADSGIHGDEVRIQGECAFHAEPAIGQGVADPVQVSDQICQGVDGGHGDGPVVVFQGASREIRQFFDDLEHRASRVAGSSRGAFDALERLLPQPADHVERGDEGEDEGEIGQENEQAARHHDEGQPEGRLGERAGKWWLVAEGGSDPEAQHGGKYEEARHQRIDGFADEEIGDAVRVARGSELDHDGDYGERDGE